MSTGSSKVSNELTDHKLIGHDLAEEIKRLVKEAVSHVELKHLITTGNDVLSAQKLSNPVPEAEKVVADALTSDVVSALFAEQVREAERLLEDSTNSHRSLWEVMMSLCDDRAHKLQRVKSTSQQRGVKELKDKIVPQLVKSYPWLQLCTSIGPFRKSSKYEGHMIQELQQQIIELTLALREKGADFENEQRRHRALQTECSDLADEFKTLQFSLKEHQESARLREQELQRQNQLAQMAAESAQRRSAITNAWLHWTNLAMHDKMALRITRMHDNRVYKTLTHLFRNHTDGKQRNALSVWKWFSNERDREIRHQDALDTLIKANRARETQLKQKAVMSSGLRQWMYATSLSKLEGLLDYTRESYEHRLDAVRNHAQYRSILRFWSHLTSANLRFSWRKWKAVCIRSRLALRRWSKLDMSRNKHSVWSTFACWTSNVRTMQYEEKLSTVTNATKELYTKNQVLSRMKNKCLRERTQEHRTLAAKSTMAHCFRATENVRKRVVFKHYKRWLHGIEEYDKAQLQRRANDLKDSLHQMISDRKAFETLHEIEFAFHTWKQFTARSAEQTAKEQHAYDMALIEQARYRERERAKLEAKIRRDERLRRDAFASWKDHKHLCEVQDLQEQLRAMETMQAFNERLQRIELGLSNIVIISTQHIRRMLKRRFREWLLQVLLEQDLCEFEPIAPQDREPSLGELNSQAVRLRAIESTLGRLIRRISSFGGSVELSHSYRTPISSQQQQQQQQELEQPKSRTDVANMIFRVTADARNAKQMCLDAYASAKNDSDKLDELEDVQDQIQGLIIKCEEEWREHFSPYLKVPLEAAARYASQKDAARALFRDMENTPISSQIKEVLRNIHEATSPPPRMGSSEAMNPEDAYNLGVQEGLERSLVDLERLKAAQRLEQKGRNHEEIPKEKLKKEKALKKWLERAHKE